MTKKKLYFFVFVACVTGYGWVILNAFSRANIHIGCLFYKLTHIPCPACGSTRSVLALLNGDFSGAFYDNPFGFVLVLLMILLPAWLVFDFFGKKESFACAYQKMETLFKKKSFAVPGILLVLGNWIWNLYKYL